MIERFDEDDDDDDDNSMECMKVFLNGISIQDISEACDDNDDNIVDNVISLEVQHPTNHGMKHDPVILLDDVHNRPMNDTVTSVNYMNDDWYTYAYTIVPNATITSPNDTIQIVYNHTIRGYGLYAKQYIPKGTILYTESTILVSQIPCSIRNNNNNNNTPINQQEMHNSNNHHHHIHNLNRQTSSSSCYKVQACQYCFTSLESLSSCMNKIQQQQQSRSTTITTMNTNRNVQQQPQHTTPEQQGLLLPLPHLYPVPEWKFTKEQQQQQQNHHMTTTSTTTTTTKHLNYCITDDSGRMICTSCHSVFCSISCYNQFIYQYDACCYMYTIMKQLPKLLCTNNNNTNTKNNTASSILQPQHDQNSCIDHDNTNDDDEDIYEVVQPAIPLAIRMYISLFQSYRRNQKCTTNTPTGDNNTTTTTTNQYSNDTILHNIILDLCGSHDEIHTLELGIPIPTDKDENNLQTQYTVKPIYLYIVDIYSISIFEQQVEILSYPTFVSLVVKAARNGFGIRTQSSFQTYYSSILRTNYYNRNSEPILVLQNIISQYMNHDNNNTSNSSTTTSNPKYGRNIDRMIDELICTEVVAYYPLTSRMNHSCVPNVMIQSQNYINASIDVVALHDIPIHEEITISYIHSIHRKSYEYRQHELYSKYLFHCNCPLCTKQSISK